jgi:hypothetical protein
MLSRAAVAPYGHLMLPLGAIRQLTRQSERNASSAMGGNGLWPA